MKKLTSLLLVGMLASVASAASINWGFGGNTWVSEDGTSSVIAKDYAGTATSGSSLALVYVGQNVSSLTDAILADITASDVVDSAPYAMGTGKGASTWSVTGASPSSVSSSDYSVGASFAVLFYNGSEYDYVYSVDATSGAVGSALKENVITLTDLSDNAQAVSIFATRKGGSNVAGAVRAVSVPEPATGALALAGIALLFKRRKA